MTKENLEEREYLLEDKFNNCLFFTTTRLYRAANKLIEEEFKNLGMTSTYVYILLAVEYKNGITQKELAEELHLKPSTITRLIEKLIKDSYITKKMNGKLAHIYLTKKGHSIQDKIEEYRFSLNQKYKKILGDEEYENLLKLTNKSAEILEKF